MKLVFLIVFIVISFLLSLQFILPQKEQKIYTNEELRNKVLSHAMQSIPKTYEELLAIYNITDDSLSKEKIALGKKLYFDKNFSKNQQISCNSCHTIKQKNDKTLLNTLLDENTQVSNCAACHTMDSSGTDRLTFSSGENTHTHMLNVQTIYNAAFAKFFTWDGKITSLKEYIKDSITNEHKFNNTIEQIIYRLKQNPYYVEEFKKIFQTEINFENISKALEAYIKTLLTRSAYDDFLDGNDTAISDEAKRGLGHFINFGCKGCHTGISLGGQSMQRFPLRTFARIHDVRPNIDLKEKKIVDTTFPFENQGGYLGKDDTNFFRVPMLRNVTKTSPYFHNGSVFKLRKAVDIMAKHQIGKTLSNKQIDELVEFLGTLEGELVDYGVIYDK